MRGNGETTGVVRDRFYANWSLVILVLILASFPLTYFIPVSTGSKQFAPIVHVHGAIFFSWAALFAWQSHLVAQGKVARHREIGLAGIAISALMLPMGMITAAEAIARRIGEGNQTPYDFAFFNLIDILLFSGLMVAAIATVTRHREWHRRFIFGAALSLLSPAFSRWTLQLPFAAPWPDLITYGFDALLVVLALHDRRVIGKIHPATWWTAAALVPLHVASPFIAYGEWWRSVAPAIFDPLLLGA
ncbi:hypothetical protein [Qipengyuania soli]|uniref:DUF2306 domain-containing protein n=1 Tax=Qipengyuania soli TaxID=2782568 RepID=A0A7S8F1M1_9SPHN|nr:hypothetical protein [Qipengyuania soli]QPC98300.1 hypothetical protein IRL76_10590 [Qipengyuania soli]